MQTKKTAKNGKNPTLQQIHNALTHAPREVRKQICDSLDVTESIAYAIIRGERVCSPAEREAIARIYGKEVSQITWTEKESVLQ